MQSVVRLKLSSLDEEAGIVAFEPEGQTVALPRGEILSVEVRGPANGEVEVGWDRDGLTVARWQGSVVRAWDRKGKEIAL